MPRIPAAHRATAALGAVFLCAWILARLVAPAGPAPADAAERLLGPRPPTRLSEAGRVSPVATPERAPRDARRRAAGYTAETVAEGGTIRGVVRFASRPARWEIPYGKCQEACGHTSYPTERVVFDEATLGVANCVVYLVDVSRGKAWSGPFAKGEDDRVALLDQKECRYHPHVIVVRTKTQLQVRNSDGAEHNVHAYYRSYRTTQFNQMTGAHSWWPEIGEAFLEKPGRYLVTCDIHPWMSGHVHAFRHPYFARTGRDGAFELSDVPPGAYTLVCWHEGMRETPQLGAGGITGYDYGPDVELRAKVTVKPGDVVTRDFTIPAPVPPPGDRR